MDDKNKKRRRTWLRLTIAFTMLSVIGIFAFWAKPLWFPVLTAFACAYLSKPLIHTARLRGIPRSMSVFVIGSVLVAGCFYAVKTVQESWPTGLDKVKKMVKVQHQLNEKIARLLKVKEGVPSPIYKNLHNEIDSLMSSVNGYITPSKTEIESLVVLLKAQKDTEAENLLNMVETNSNRNFWVPGAVTEVNLENSLHKLSVSALAAWLLFPVVFFFLLLDDGSIQRFFMNFVPNHYFELTLTVLERVDKALGHYLRGTALECAAVGACISLGLFLFGFDFGSACAIGVLAGVTNAIPFFGTVVGLVAGSIYAIMVDNIQPILPYVTADHAILGVVISVTVAHLLDNMFFQPILVGRAVNLHPIVIILAVAVGGTAFGFLGILLAIPSVVAIKVFLETLHAGLRDYRLI